MTKTEMLIKLEAEIKKARSAWRKGVATYAYGMIEELEIEELPFDNLKPLLLNGAKDWKQYSYGGSGVALCYNYDIAHMLCNATELKLTKEGMKEPNKNESWLDVQARAIYQAYCLILSHNTK